MPSLGPRGLKLLLQALGLAGAAMAAGLWQGSGPKVATVVTGISVVAALSVPRLWKNRAYPVWAVVGIHLPLIWWWGGTVLAIPLGILLLAWQWAGVAALRLDLSAWGPVAHGVGLVLAGWGVLVERHWIRVREHEIPVADLSPEFDGYRLVHVSDLHINGFTSLSRAMRWVERIRRVAPDLVAITGDFSSRSSYRMERVMLFAEALLAATRGTDGVVVSLGNHERLCAQTVETLLEQRGVRVLRGRWYPVRRGAAEILLVGLDDWQRDPSALAELLHVRPSRAPAILLAHSPQLVAFAGGLGADLVLMGHTHGGQLGFPGLGDWVNLATLTGQRARGLSLRGKSWECVNAGLGTSGPPLRLGVRPEIVTLVLRCPRATIAAA